jgi:glycerol dehydrogenase-like iron-containing ADH family enzyme
MNLRQLLRQAGISNDIVKEVERKSKKISEQTEQEHQEKAMAMTKMLLNDALRYRKEHGNDKQAAEQVRTIILPDEK